MHILQQSCNSPAAALQWKLLTYVCNFTIFRGCILFSLIRSVIISCLYLLCLFVYLSGSNVVTMTNSLEDSKQLCFFSFSSFIATLYQQLLHSCTLRTLPLLWGVFFLPLIRVYHSLQHSSSPLMDLLRGCLRAHLPRGLAAVASEGPLSFSFIYN